MAIGCQTVNVKEKKIGCQTVKIAKGILCKTVSVSSLCKTVSVSPAPTCEIPTCNFSVV